MAFFHDITVDDRRCILVLPEINWSRRPKLTVAHDTDRIEGPTGLAPSSPTREVARFTVDYRFTFEGAAAQEFIDTIAALNTGDPDWRLLLPLWPDALPAADYTDALRIFTPSHWINYDPATGAYSLDAAGGYARSVGLVMCSLLDAPRSVLGTDVDGRIDVKAEENAPWEARVLINERAKATWDFEADFARAPDDTWSWARTTKQIGHGREKALSGEDRPLLRGQTAQFTFESRDEIREALTFFTQHEGARHPFTVPLYYRPSILDNLQPEMQATFADDALTLEFANQDQAKTELTFRQHLLLAEGEPSQERPAIATLHTVWWDGSATVRRWTDWERTITSATLGGDYVWKKIEHKAEAENLQVGTADWQVMLDDFDGNPLRAFTLLQIERRLHWQIHECDPANPDATLTLRFAGEVSTAPSTGDIYTAKLVLLGGRLQRYMPNFYHQVACNYTLFSELCGLNKDDWRVDGTLDDRNGVVVDVACDDESEADWFANGFAKFGADDDAELRFILRSEPIEGGQRLTLHKPLRAIAIDAAVQVYPGCDGQFLGKCAALDNQDNHGGAPWQPSYIAQVSSGFSTKTGK